MIDRRTRALSLSTLLFLITAPAVAEVRLPNIFGDHMVLQSGKPVTVWGWADPGETISVSFAKQKKGAEAAADGKWSVRLDALEASFTGRDLVVSGEKSERKISDVLVGEVWVCGGQSNMAWTLRGSRDADIEIDSADSPAIRFIRLPTIARATPQDDFPVDSPKSPTGNWRQAIPEQVENCTAVGYYFARRLHRRLRVPVGLVDTSWGGTMAQHWVTKETLRPIEAMQPYFETYETARKAWIDAEGQKGAHARYAKALEDWDAARADAEKAGKRAPRRPNQKAFANPDEKGHPGAMLYGVVSPITKLAIRGVVFYQGENNSFGVSWKPFPKTYPAVISDWRRLFGNPELPFGLIQISGWSTRRSMTYDMNHHTNVVREIQFRTWRSTPKTGLVVTFDTNSSRSIHPGRKLPVGERTARWALAEVYGITKRGSKDPLEWKGPIFESSETRDGKILVRFEKGSDRGLVLDQDVEAGFYIAGEDRVFHHARARIRDGGVEIWSDEVPKPVAVRYAFSNLPAGGLMNGRELPAYPFRTDTWPMTPHQSTGSYEVDKL